MMFRHCLAVAIALALCTGPAGAEDGHMMDGGGWHGSWMGGSGGVWIPILLVVIAGLLVTIAMLRRK